MSLLPAHAAHERSQRALDAPIEDVVARLVADVGDAIARAGDQGAFECTFHVPILLPGLPAYDQETVRDRLRARLERAGYAVGDTPHAAKLCVGWGAASCAGPLGPGFVYDARAPGGDVFTLD